MRQLLRVCKLIRLWSLCLLGSLSLGQMPVSAQLLAQYTQHIPNVVGTDRYRLTDIIGQLSDRYHTNILFEERALRSLYVPASAVRPQATLKASLTALLQPLGLSYRKVKNNYVILTNEKAGKDLPVSSAPNLSNDPGPLHNFTLDEGRQVDNQQQRTPLVDQLLVDVPVSGKVTSETGEVLPGVNIVIKGTQRGATTDQNGRFKLDVPNGKTVLIFSFIGYVRQEITVDNQSVIDVSLKADDQSLNEVVVVGYGEQKKSDLTGAVASLQPKDITRANPILASKALQGQVAGVTVTKSDNRPGSGYNITIRGENTINNSTAPLVVIDGLIGGDINNLNPNDIQSMDVLKDASSTAIYGARGANGVIIITTKKGVSGKPRVSYDSYVGVKLPAHVPKLMNTAQYYKSVYTDKILEGSTPATFTANELDNIKNNHTTDWVGLITKPGLQMSQNISVSGGSERTTYRFSGGFLNEDGNVISTGYKRYNLNAGLDSKLGDHFRVGFTSYVTYSDQNFGSQESLRGAYRARPTGTIYYKDLLNPSENSDFDLNGMAYWMGINAKQVPNPLADTDPQQSKLQTTTANIIGNAYVGECLLNCVSPWVSRSDGV